MGGLKDWFIRMCTDCIAVKTQLLRSLFFNKHTRFITIHILAKSHSHHYPGLLKRFRSRSGLQNNSENILILI